MTLQHAKQRFLNDIKLTKDEAKITDLNARIEQLKSEAADLQQRIPDDWESVATQFKTLNSDMIKARRSYQNNVDTAYMQLAEIEAILAGTENAASLAEPLQALAGPIESGEIEASMEEINEVESMISSMTGLSKVKSLLSKSRRALKKGEHKRPQAIEHYQQALALYADNIAWREAAQPALLPALTAFKSSLDETVGIRSQKKLTLGQAKYVARCQSTHKDISIDF